MRWLTPGCRLAAGLGRRDQVVDGVAIQGAAGGDLDLGRMRDRFQKRLPLRSGKHDHFIRGCTVATGILAICHLAYVRMRVYVLDRIANRCEVREKIVLTPKCVLTWNVANNGW
jgi:hypothetical protein